MCHLGTVPYREALAIQERVRARRQAGELPDTLLLLEHPPVYTRGRRSRRRRAAAGRGLLPRAGHRGASTTDRGGRVTYHGPGQLVGYPIMRIEDVASATCARWRRRSSPRSPSRAIGARARVADGPDYTGVWVEERKIASIGVHVSRGVTTHGFAVNVDNDLEPFAWVVACGLPDVSMTSLASSDGVARRAVAASQRAYRFCEAHGAPAPGLTAAPSTRDAAGSRAGEPRRRAIRGGGARMSAHHGRGRTPGAWTC